MIKTWLYFLEYKYHMNINIYSYKGFLYNNTTLLNKQKPEPELGI